MGRFPVMSDKSPSTEQLWELLSVNLRSFLRQRLSDDQLAEDLLQETFIRIHRKIGDLDDMQRIEPWVFQIARNLLIDYYRSQSRLATQMADDLVATETATDSNLNEVVAGWLPQMISQLPDTYREAVELYELQGIPQQEIAERLGISLSGAKSRIQRGREKLKSILFDCCTIERDRRGNVIGYARNSPDEPNDCGDCDVSA